MLEPYQIKRLEIMKEILECVSENFILKGGTALKFYYGLDRYSDDLDFDSVSNNMDIIKCLKKHKDFTSWKIYEKKVTESSVRLTIDYGAKSSLGNYPLEIDISGRNKMLLRNKELAYSKINGVCIYDIEVIAQMKRQAFLSRDKIRDFYDIGFLLEKYPHCFDKQNLIDIADKIYYRGAEELNLILIDETQTHRLIVASNDTKSICNYAEKILQRIDWIQNAISVKSNQRQKTTIRK